MREVLALLDHGDVDGALARLHTDYDPVVRRYLAARVRPGDVDDLVQDVWEAARSALARFRRQASPRTWLLRIARNKLVDHARRPGMVVSFDSATIAGDALASAIGLHRPRDPSTLLRARERTRALERALDELTESERELLELRFVVGLRPSEIVELLALAITPNALSQRIVRLARRLRRILVEHDAFASRGRGRR
jgi:RNA polymerase sigma-70 factor (ECF subfamily)